MKINNKKIIVSTLALAMGAALAGSISGSVAWYQYSTRAAAVINGVSAGVTGDMAVSVDGSAFAEKATSPHTYEFIPISASQDSSGDLTYLGHPVYQTPALPELTSPDTTVAPTASTPDTLVHYYDYQLKFRFYESTTNAVANADPATPVGTAVTDKEVYLTYFDIEGELAPAVRVEIIPDASVNTESFFLSDTSEETVTTHGSLDLNGNGVLDTNYWDCSDSTGSAIVYNNGAADSTYDTDNHDDVVLAQSDLASAYSFTNKAGKEVGITDGTTTLIVRVWLEGWAELTNEIKPANGTNIDGLNYFTDEACETAASGTADGDTTYYYKSSSWDFDKIGTDQFNINMQFACEANK